jgi:hypothetical protein
MIPEWVLIVELFREQVLPKKHEPSTELVAHEPDHPAESEPTPNGSFFNQQTIVTSGGTMTFGLDDEAGVSGSLPRMQYPRQPTAFYTQLWFHQDEALPFSGNPSIYGK